MGPMAGLEECGKSPDRPARSEWLYRMSYPGRHFFNVSGFKNKVSGAKYQFIFRIRGALQFQKKKVYNFTFFARMTIFV